MLCLGAIEEILSTYLIAIESFLSNKKYCC